MGQENANVFIRQKQLLRDGLVPFSGTTLWRKVRDASFPKPVRFSNRVSAWRLQDILDWQKAQLGETSGQPNQGAQK